MISTCGADELAQPGRRLLLRAVRRVAVVQTHLDSVRDDVVGDTAVDLRRAQHLHEREAADLDLERRHRHHRAEPLHRDPDRVHALPRASRVGAFAAKDERRIQVPETAGMDLAVGRLEHDDEIRFEHERRFGEDAGQGALIGGQLLANEEEKAEIELQGGAGRRPVGELDHHRHAALHVAGAQPGDPAVLDPAGEISLLRHRVQVPGEQDERALRPRRREQQRLVGRVGERKRHRVAHVREQRLLRTARGRDVYQLQRAACEIRGHGVGG